MLNLAEQNAMYEMFKESGLSEREALKALRALICADADVDEILNRR